MSFLLTAVAAAAKKKFGKDYKYLTDEQREELRQAIESGEFKKKEESMNIKEIAAKLVSLREKSVSALTMSGQLREELGFDGYSEALRQRWIMADQDGSGMVQITNHMGTLESMRELAEEYEKDQKCHKCDKKGDGCKCKKCPGCNKVSCTCKDVKESLSNASHGHANGHANRPRLQEIATLGLGDPDLGAPRDTMASRSASPAPAAPAAAPAAPAPSSPAQGAVDVGTDVKIVQDGKEYTGKVSQVKSDGKMAISFAAERPSMERDYDKAELTPVQATA